MKTKFSNREEILNGILEENAARLAVRVFNPRTGEGAPGTRVRVEMNCPFLGRRTMYLPKTMMNSPLGRSVIENGGVERVAKDKGLSPEMIAELFELVRLRQDFPYWASKYGLIRPKRGGENIPLILNFAQRKLVGKFEEMRESGRPIRVILLKARQWGGSTVIQLYMVWIQLVGRVGLNSLVVSHQNAATEEIRAMMKRVVENYPEDLLNADFDLAEKGIKVSRGSGTAQLKAVGRSGNSWNLAARNCDFKIGTAERPDSTRGGSYSLVHLSEVGIWKATDGKKPEDIVVSATSGVLTEPDTFIALESTAKGKGTYFHNEYRAARKGQAQWDPVFIPWYEIEQYSLPLADSRSFALRLFDEKDNVTGDERSESGQYLWRLWEKGATLEAINWYVWERRKYDKSSSMASEYPSDDVEAFANSETAVFSEEQVKRLSESVREGKTYKFGKYEVELWEKYDQSGIYLTLLEPGAKETRRRTTGIVLNITDPRNPLIAAQLKGGIGYAGAIEAVSHLSGKYGKCEIAIVADGNSLPEVAHTSHVANCLWSKGRYIYRPSSAGYVYEVDDKSRIEMSDVLSDLIDCGRWREPSKEALSQYETLEADPTEGYRPSSGASDDLLLIRKVGAYICTRELG